MLFENKTKRIGIETSCQLEQKFTKGKLNFLIAIDFVTWILEIVPFLKSAFDAIQKNRELKNWFKLNLKICVAQY